METVFGRSPARPTPTAPEDDRLLAESTFYQELARSAGYKSWNEAWDSLFEFGVRRDPENREAVITGFNNPKTSMFILTHEYADRIHIWPWLCHAARAPL